MVQPAETGSVELYKRNFYNAAIAAHGSTVECNATESLILRTLHIYLSFETPDMTIMMMFFVFVLIQGRRLLETLLKSQQVLEYCCEKGTFIFLIPLL